MTEIHIRLDEATRLIMVYATRDGKGISFAILPEDIGGSMDPVWTIKYIFRRMEEDLNKEPPKWH